MTIKLSSLTLTLLGLLANCITVARRGRRLRVLLMTEASITSEVGNTEAHYPFASVCLPIIGLSGHICTNY